MNSLSWLIYLADVIPNLIAIPIFMLVAVAVFVFVGIRTDKNGYYESEYPCYAFLNGDKTHRFLVFVTVPILTLMIIIVPSRLTIYLIAASEISEQIATSDKGSATLDEINNIIQLKLDDIRKEFTEER